MSMSAVHAVRIAIIDDHPMTLHGMCALIDKAQDCHVVGRFSHSRALLAELQVTEVDVLIMDYVLAADDIDGNSLLRTLQRQFPDLPVLVVSELYNSAAALLTLNSGAKGFSGKNMAPGELIEAVRIVASGQIYLLPEMALQLTQLLNGDITLSLQPLRTNSPQQTSDLSVLSPKEQEVVRCLLQGMSVTQIAKKSHRSIKTISGQKQTALRKLGLKSDEELMRKF
ncbi:response regulator [Pantoea dispersa]|uniref:response regulator transcription factor n=1 Tax=Pantoea dispersa TaxID=59814 RepID=UPI002DBA48DE|nr:response regulator transcription factor [Pantoea dispersa]MEB5972563.1 response regulator transcription factor [Pantoea dispersa]